MGKRYLADVLETYVLDEEKRRHICVANVQLTEWGLMWMVSSLQEVSTASDYVEQGADLRCRLFFAVPGEALEGTD